MGLLGSKEERECKRARRKCEKNQKKCERKERRRERRECRQNRRCRRTPYICVEDECCDDGCLGNFVQVNNFQPTPKFRMYNPVCGPCGLPPCCPSPCGSPCSPCPPPCGLPPCCPSPCGSPCLPPCDPCLSPFSNFNFGSGFGGGCCGGGSDPVAELNNIFSSFPPGTDFSGLLSSLPNLMGNDSFNNLDLNNLSNMFNSISPSQALEAVQIQNNLMAQANNNLESLVPQIQPKVEIPCAPPAPPPPAPCPPPPPAQAPAQLPTVPVAGDYTMTSSNPNLNIPTSQGPISILVKNQLPPMPTTSQALQIPPLPPVSRDLIYSKRPSRTTRRKYAYDDYDGDYYSRRSRSRPVEFYDDYGIDGYYHHDRDDFYYDD